MEGSNGFCTLADDKERGSSVSLAPTRGASSGSDPTVVGLRQGASAGIDEGRESSNAKSKARQTHGRFAHTRRFAPLSLHCKEKLYIYIFLNDHWLLHLAITLEFYVVSLELNGLYITNFCLRFVLYEGNHRYFSDF